MSLSISLQFRTPLPRASLQSPPPRRPSHRFLSSLSETKTLTISRNTSINRLRTAKAVEESKERAKSETEEERDPAATDEVSEPKVELSELGAEIKKAMQEKKEEAEGNFLSGVVEEIREIEWPAFGKVLGTTGVVLGVIAGSSVVLLTVNAVLAELSDRVFSGRGVQDLFG